MIGFLFNTRGYYEVYWTVNNNNISLFLSPVSEPDIDEIASKAEAMFAGRYVEDGGGEEGWRYVEEERRGGGT